ncbi:MAG: BREX-4 system phosphatase PglZ, partial [Eubacteriales bacterium]|nr:BREX-4 system phosphatase PglZ [Eubacteriales bacterium]
MAYSLNTYSQYRKSKDTRLEIYPNNDVAAQLLSLHRQDGSAVFSVSECISDLANNLPMPNDVFAEIDKQVRVSTNRMVVVGIDAYLSLLDEENISAFMTALFGRIDAQKLNAAFFVFIDNWNSVKHHYVNPKYENSLQVVSLLGSATYIQSPSVAIVPSKWYSGNDSVDGFRKLIKSMGDFATTGDFTVTLDDFIAARAGLSQNVTQIVDVKTVAARYYGMTDSLPERTLQTVIVGAKGNGTSPDTFLAEQFDSSNTNVRMALKRLNELPDDELWSAYVWWLSKTIAASTYLSKVLSADVTKQSLLRRYIVEAAAQLITDVNARWFAEERATAIREIGIETESLIIEFIKATNNYSSEDVAPWLNCGTTAEFIEIVRRVAKSDLTIGVADVWKKLYPALADYLSVDFDYGNKELNAYFNEYRKLKISDRVTEAFSRRALDSIVPSSFTARNAVLQTFSADNDIALLVVDGMGAEYYPLILSMAKRRGMNVESCCVANANIPSSTEFNAICWVDGKRLDPLNGIDNIVHNGAEKHEKCSFEQNFVATLDVFTNIFNRIAEGLSKYSRVVLTSDHGSSRLAVLAHNAELDKTLPWSGEPADWRYAKEPANTTRPPEFEAVYNAERNVRYWVVRGYNRLPKSGPKLYELHGGATLEERLVPLIVFSKTKSATDPKQLGRKMT